MKGTLGLILDIINQSDKPIGENEFRQAVMYGLCPDYIAYQPLKEFQPFVAHWQMFQLREYYIYALYALWEYFLSWLRQSGPRSLEDLWEHLDRTIDLGATSKVLNAYNDDMPSPSSILLADYLELLTNLNGVEAGELNDLCDKFALSSQMPLSEEAVFQVLKRQRDGNPSLHVSAAWMLLANIYLRMRGMHLENEIQEEGYWAVYGGARRRSPKLFLDHMNAGLDSGQSVLDVWKWLYRDYIIAQHTITALEKWNTRNANTFHFNYVDGLFEFVDIDRPVNSATRFNRAHDMLFDLGLFDVVESGVQNLTPLGEKTLGKVLESLND